MKIEKFIEGTNYPNLFFQDSKGNRESLVDVLKRFVSPMEQRKKELKEKIQANKKRLECETMSIMTEMAVKIELEKQQFALEQFQTL